MAKKSAFCNFVQDALSPFGHITIRAMFGGFGVYQDRVIVGIIAHDVLYFKVDASNQAQYEMHGSKPFTYMGKNKPIQMSYWNVPLSVLEDEEALGQWLAQSYHISKKR